MKELTLVIPAKEEVVSLPIVLDEIKNKNCKVIVVMSKEDTRTFEAVKNLNCEILFQSGKGYGNAIIEGIKKAKTKYISIFYADGSTDPKYLEPMLEKIKEHKKSIVFGSRYEKGGHSYDDDLVTRVGNYFFTMVGNILFSLKISDILFTYIVAKREDLEIINLKSHNYCLCVELPLKAKKMNILYSTHPCIERKRFADKKKVKAFTVGLSILIYLIKDFFNLNTVDRK